MFQKELYSGTPNVSVASVTKTFTLKDVQNINRLNISCLRTCHWEDARKPDWTEIEWDTSASGLR
jgi:hypothetical protein